MLEKMIRDAMHQSVIYKEQVRLNQAAANALMARLEAQRAICDASEKELHRKFRQRDEIEKQIRPEWEQARKRSRMDDTLFEERDDKTLLCLHGSRPRTPRSRMDDASFDERDGKTVLSLPEMKPTPIHKELRVFLEEEQKASEAALSLNEERKQEITEQEENEPVMDIASEKPRNFNKSIVIVENENPIEDKLQTLKIGEYNIQLPVPREPEREEDEESRRQRGKGNVEKWLQMLLENNGEELGPQSSNEHEASRTDEIIRKMNRKYPQKEIKILRFPESKEKEKVHGENKQRIVLERDGGKRKEEILEIEASKSVTEKNNASEVGSVGKKVGSSMSFEGKERREKCGKERGLVRSESARAFRPIPSSPSVILGMRRGVDCIGKKPMVTGDDNGDEERAVGNNFIKSSIKTIKKAVKI
ncbi:hypothetical protein L1049_001800 [Liquidambar formosana]|uniref:Uncharacterized protein n=1 Tax=Liquidambar formosana TaxID=63359 RepID=A0AAP0R2M0_LIQFO